MLPRSHLCLWPALLILAACGGGGGGGGSAALQPTAVITEDNALAITQEVFTASDLAGDGELPGSDAAAAAVTGSVVGRATAARLGMAVSDWLVLNRSAIVASAALPLVTYACDSGGNFSVEYLSATRSRITFTDCNGASEFGFSGLINGILDIEDNDPGQQQVLDFSADFIDFSMVENGSVFSVAGDMRLRIRDLTDGVEYTHERIDTFVTRLRMSIDDLTITLREFDSALETLYSPTENLAQEDFQGALDGDAFAGIVTFETTVPIVVDYEIGDYFVQGNLLIHGVDDSSIVVEFDSSGDVDAQVDTDGDGVTDFTPVWTFDDLMALL